MLTLDSFTPAPVESLNYLPAQRGVPAAQHRRRAVRRPELYPGAADRLRPQPGLEGQLGPDPQGVRQQDRRQRDLNEQTAQQELQTNTASARHAVRRLPADRVACPGLVAQMKQGLNQNFNLGPSVLLQPVLRLQPGLAEQRRCAGQGRGAAGAQLRDQPGPSDPGHQPDGQPAADPRSARPASTGRRHPAGYNPYPYNPTKAKQLLAAAGVKNRPEPHHALPAATQRREPRSPRPRSPTWPRSGSRSSCSAAHRRTSTRSTWRSRAWPSAACGTSSIAGWGPDWYGDAALSFFSPLFSGPAVLPAGGQQLRLLQQPVGHRADHQGRVHGQRRRPRPDLGCRRTRTS